MILLTQIRLERAEQQLLQEKGLPHLELGLRAAPGNTEKQRRDNHDTCRRAFNHVSRGNASGAESLINAALAVNNARKTAELESHEDYWKNAATTAQGKLGGGLIYNKDQFVNSMTEIRRLQLAELTQCADLLSDALITLSGYPNTKDED